MDMVLPDGMETSMKTSKAVFSIRAITKSIVGSASTWGILPLLLLLALAATAPA
jgi:hypothetical protein